MVRLANRTIGVFGNYTDISQKLLNISIYQGSFGFSS